MAREDDATTPDPTGSSAEAMGPGTPPPFVPGQRGVHHPRDPRAHDGDVGPQPPAAEPTESRPADTTATDPFTAFPQPAPPADARTAPSSPADGPHTPHGSLPATPHPTIGRAGDAEEAPVVEGPPDEDLADRVRAGDGDAYAPLYERHSPAVRRYARTCTRTPEAADDLCAEAFARTLHALRTGHGPREAVRAYLLTTVRNVAGDWTRSNRREWLTEDFTVFEAAWESQDRVVKADDARLAMLAFQDLPERSKVVLWHVDIEGEQAVQVAPLLGENPDNVRKILERARQELRDNYFVAFATGGVKDENCKKFTRHYGRHIRNRMDSAKRRESIDAHLRKCSRCNDTYAEMVDVRDRYGPIAIAMIGITAPMFLSGSASAAGAAAAGTVAAAGMGLAAGATGGGAVAGGVAAGAAMGAGAGTAAARNAGRAGRQGTRTALAAGGVVAAAAVVALALVGDDEHTPRHQAPPVAVSAPTPPSPSPPPAAVPTTTAPAPTSPPAPPATEAASPRPTPAATVPLTVVKPHAPVRPPRLAQPAPTAAHASPKPSPTRPRATPKPRPTLSVGTSGFHADDNGIALDCANKAGDWCGRPTISVPRPNAGPLLPSGSSTACVPVEGVNGTAYTLCPR